MGPMSCDVWEECSCNGALLNHKLAATHALGRAAMQLKDAPTGLTHGFEPLAGQHDRSFAMLGRNSTQ